MYSRLRMLVKITLPELSNLGLHERRQKLILVYKPVPVKLHGGSRLCSDWTGFLFGNVHIYTFPMVTSRVLYNLLVLMWFSL